MSWVIVSPPPLFYFHYHHNQQENLENNTAGRVKGGLMSWSVLRLCSEKALYRHIFFRLQLPQNLQRQ